MKVVQRIIRCKSSAHRYVVWVNGVARVVETSKKGCGFGLAELMNAFYGYLNPKEDYSSPLLRVENAQAPRKKNAIQLEYLRDYRSPFLPIENNQSSVVFLNDYKISKAIAAGFLTVFTSSLLIEQAVALPTGAQSVSGDVQFTTTGSTMDVTTQASRAIAKYDSFNVAAHERVNFNLPSSSSVILNRVTGANPSEIAGRIDSNGKVLLVTPNGVMFSQGSQVNVGSFVVSTKDVTNDNFLNSDQLKFEHGPGQARASIDNKGSITANNGTVVLLADQVNNSGQIASNGSHLVVGDSVNVNLANGIDAQVTVNEGIKDLVEQNKAAIDNSGNIQGNYVTFQAKFDSAVSQGIVNNSGVIEASSLVLDGGKIEILASGGLAQNSGQLLANSSVANGGNISVSGQYVALEETSHIEANGKVDGGHIKIGGGLQGKDTTIENAEKTFVAQGAVLKANAGDDGNGGNVIVWSDDTTYYYGDIEAKGGIALGNGGFAEVSGKNNLDFNGTVNLLSSNGEHGTLLLDPLNIIVSSSAGAGFTSPPSSILFANNAGTTYTINSSFLANATSNIVLQATNNITFDMTKPSSIAQIASNELYISQPGVSLTAQAGNNVYLNYRIRTNGGDVNFYANHASGPASGSGRIIIDNIWGGIRTNGGNVTLSGQGLTNTGYINTCSSGSCGNITLNSDTAVRVDGALSGQNLNITSGTSGIALQGNIDLTGDAYLTTTGNIYQNEFGVAGDYMPMFAGPLDYGLRFKIAPNNKLVVASFDHNNTIYVVDLNTGITNGQYGVQFTGLGGWEGVTDVAITPDGSQMYAVKYWPGATGVVQGPFDLTTNTNTGSSYLATPSRSSDATFSPTGDYLYVFGGGNTYKYNYSSGLSLQSTINGVAYLKFTDNTGQNAVGYSGSDFKVVNLATNTISSTIATGSLITSYALSADGTKAWVTSNTAISEIDLNTNSVTKSVTLSGGTQLSGATINSDQSRLYLQDNSQNKWFTVDLNSMTSSGVITPKDTINYTASVATTPYGYGSLNDTSYMLNGNQRVIAAYERGNGSTLSGYVPMGNITLAANRLNYSAQGTVNFSKINLPSTEVTHLVTGNALASNILDLQDNALSATISSSLSLNATNNFHLGNIDVERFEFKTDGNIFLDGDVSLSGLGTAAVIASTDGSFINNGSGSLSAPNGRYILYSDSPGNTELGSLVIDVKRYNRTYDSHPPSSIIEAGNLINYSITPVITVTADNKARVYGANNPAFTATYSGFIDGDTLADVTGSTNLTSSADQSSNAGLYIIDSAGSLSSDLGYQFNYVDATLTVTKATVTVTPNSFNRHYAQPNPVLTAAYQGFVNGDDILDIDTSATLTTSATTDSLAGRYAITASGALDNNYNFTYQPGYIVVEGLSEPEVIPFISNPVQNFGVTRGSNDIIYSSEKTEDTSNPEQLFIPEIDTSAVENNTNPNTQIDLNELNLSLK